MTPKLVSLHPRLFIRGHTRGIDSATMLNTLREHKISFVLNVALIPDEYLQSACRTIGIHYEHEPLHDSMDGITIKVPILIETVVEALKNDIGVLCHCDSGFNRSALVAIPALVAFTGVSARAIIDDARKQRPRLLHNSVFEKWVCDYRPASTEKVE